MKGFLSLHRPVHLVATLLTLFGLLLGTLALSSLAYAKPQKGVMHPSVSLRPQYLYAGTAQDTTFACQSSTAAVRCYGPKQIRTAYSIQPLLNGGITGAGRTIVIVDAYQSPTIANDLHVFDTLFNLNDPTLNIIAPDGLTPFNQSDPNQVGWAGEISLDVEWAHAVAPDATIDLVLAKSNQDVDLLSALNYAIDHNLGDTISQSFGEGETCVGPPESLINGYHAAYRKAVLKGITVFASSGDQGAAQPTCNGSSFFLSASFPADDPYVTGVGGTQLFADPTTGAYQHEVAWNEPQYQAASGGGFSTIYPKPFYQYGIVPGKYRGIPDVAYNAAINGGVLTVWSTSGRGPNRVFIFGGTSAGSPQWAGITALADQYAGKRIGFINPTLYLVIGRVPSFYKATFHDITEGNNTFTGTDATGKPVTINGYQAKAGWDPVTGWGSPIVSKLVPLLAAFNFFTNADWSKHSKNL